MVKAMLIGAAFIAGGVYLMSRWERLGGIGRAGSVVLVMFGALMLLPLGFMTLAIIARYYFFKRIVEPLAPALAEGQEMVERNKALFAELQEHRDATDADFANLDRQWYESSSAQLTALDYRHLGDVVNKTIEQATGITTVIRIFVSADGTTAVGMFHLALPTQPARLAGRKLYTIEFETELTDGTFIATSNTGETDLTTPPPAIHRNRQPLDTPLTDLASLHETEKAKVLEGKPGVSCITIGTLAEAMESQRRENVIKAAFRKGIGYVDPEEVRRIARAGHPDDPVVEAVAVSVADIARRQEMQKESD
jgi:hypothetical protein